MKAIQNTTSLSTYSIAFAALALTGFNAQAMEYTNKNHNQHNTTSMNCSLGDAYPSSYLMDSHALGRDLYVDNMPVGSITYNYVRKTDGVSIRIYDLCVQSNKRGNGIGSECMRKFIQQSEREGISALELQSLDERLNFYKRLGFEETSNDFLFTSMIIKLESKEHVLPKQLFNNFSI
jgi:ribosomal protein S18 acetylase RimI-like enzyme